MHKILKLLPLLFLAHQAQASELQINFSGAFNPATANTTSLNGKTFNGQFNFDFLAGEYGSRGPTGSGRDNGRVELEYEDDASASVSFDSATYNVDQVELSFFDNYTPLGDQDDIDEHGWTGLFGPGSTYDVFFLDGYLSTNEEEHHDLVNGLEFSIVYLFEQDQFSFDEIDAFAQNPDLNTMLLMGASPIFRGFEFNQVSNEVVVLHGAGELTNLTVSAVPIPAAFWLFGSGLIGLVARRKRAQN